MPSYELTLILRIMNRTEIVSTLKRTGQTVLTQGGIIRQIENLGTRQLPHRKFEHNMSHMQGSYFLFHIECAPRTLSEISDVFDRDVDLIKTCFVKKDATVPSFKCTLGEELQPPAYREGVKKLLKEGSFRRDRRQPKPKNWTDEI